jgi:inward rectifier potassium channel
MMRIPWINLFLLIFVFFFLLNVLFALGYLAIGAVIVNARPASFWDAFFFSVQTIATLGYGNMAPIGFVANLLSAVEVFVGLLSLALVTGLVFSKFSRPTARVEFSRQAVVSLHQGIPSLMFRMANGRTNQILEADLHLHMLQEETTDEGQRLRRLHNMKLVRNHTPVFGLSWLAIHPIDTESPLHGKTHEDLERVQAEVIASFSGIDDTFLQMVHKQYSYLPEDITWDAVFEDVLLELPSGERAIDYEKFHQIRKLT